MKIDLRRRIRGGSTLPVAVGLVIASFPWIADFDPTLERQLSLAAIYALLVAGFNLSFGYGGQLALGQVAVFAAGAYTGALLQAHGQHELLLGFLVAVLAAAVLGLVTGLPGLRLNSWALAITAFFLVLLVPSATQIFKGQTNGSLGMPGILRPTLLGMPLDYDAFFATCIITCVVVMVLYQNLAASRFGIGLRILKESRELARSSGLSPTRMRISAYVIGSLPAGVAGVLYAYHSAYVDPHVFGFGLVTLVLAASVVGGTKSIWGAALGTSLLVIGPQEINAFREYSVMAYGVFLIVAGIGLSAGIPGVATALVHRIRPAAAAPDAPQVADRRAASADARVVIDGQPLRVEGVEKSFGTVRALSDVTMEAKPGQITAIIGANGAGKTTLLNAISGLVPPDRGRVLLGTRDIAGGAPHEIAAAGVSRTFQTPQVPEAMNVLDVVASGRIARNRVNPASLALKTRRVRRLRQHDEEVALEALAFAQLDRDPGRVAVDLPLGRRRLLEVARCIAAEPAVVLLDEPAAGLDPSGLAELRELLVRLRDAGATVVLVEHNVGFVMEVADWVVAMELGGVISQGPPEVVSSDDRVIASYLGRRAGGGPVAIAGAAD